MAEQVNMYEAKTHFSRLIERAEAGEEIVIARNGRPVARIVPHQRRTSPRVPGGWKGQVRMADDFDEPTGDYADLVDEMYNGPIFPAAGEDAAAPAERRT